MHILRSVSFTSAVVLSVLAHPAAARPGPTVTLVEAPAVPSVPSPPSVAPPDGSAPLTPGIRSQRRDALPDTPPGLNPPERRAEPNTPPQSPLPKKAEPKLSPKSEGAPKSGTAANKSAKPGIAVAQPRSAAERDKALSDLYALLATAENADQAETISASIEQLWVTSGSDTINYLMQRALAAAEVKDPALAIKLLDAVVALAPDYAEGWNRRAYVHYTQNQFDLALGDLRRTLSLDPNHFKALDGLVSILQETGHKKEALYAIRKLLDVNPFYTGAKAIADELSREIEERGI